MEMKWGRLGNRMIQITLPLLIFVIYGLLSRLPDLRLAVPEWIAGCAAIVILLAVGVYWGQRRTTAWSTGWIILMGAVFRMLFFMRPVELSDDIYRYVFDGQMILSGVNPYQASPLEMVAAHPSFSGLVTLINHADLPTIYPPAAQFVFAAGSFCGGVSGMKLLLVILDLLSCVLMVRVLNRLSLPKCCLILYAWHPLPILEIAGSAHIDGAVIFFMFLALFLMTPPTDTAHRFKFMRYIRSGWAIGFFLAAAVLTKWLPLVFLPGALLLCPSNYHRQAVCGFFFSGLIMTGAFWPQVQNGFHTLWVYAANWEFSGLLFRTFRTALESGGAARLILAITFGMSTGVLYFQCLRSVNRFQYEQTIADRWQVFRTFYAVAMAFLILTPTLHPWYGLYLAAFLPFAGGPAGIVLSWSVLLGYRVQILYFLTGQWVESDGIPQLVMAGPAAAWAASLWWKNRRTA